MRIAFIANNRSPRLFRRNPSFVYRCENVAAWLAEQGHQVTLCHLRHAPDPRELDAAVFHRPRASLVLRWVLWRYRQQGVATLVDFDDLVFDETRVRHSPAIRNRVLPLPIQWRLFRLHRRAMGWFDRVTVSTAPLADAVRQLYPGKSVTVLANAVHWSWRQDPGLLPRPRTHPRVIAYMPGTRSHDGDFAGVAPDLGRFLRDHPDTLLKITGPLNFTLDASPSQVVHEERVDFREYPRRFAGVWVNLAPLEASPFNACKSGLKAMEAGFMGVPTLYSNNPDMDRFQTAGAVPVADGDWYDALVRLRDPAIHEALTTGLRERVLTLADVADHGEGLLALLTGTPAGGHTWGP
ncbi:MAG: hypothetical protein AB1899_15315 [Pseudomonadota bacterium]